MRIKEQETRLNLHEHDDDDDDDDGKYYNIIILYYNLMGPPSYMRSFVDRNVVMRRMSVLETQQFHSLQKQQCCYLAARGLPVTARRYTHSATFPQ